MIDVAKPHVTTYDLYGKISEGIEGKFMFMIERTYVASVDQFNQINGIAIQVI